MTAPTTRDVSAEHHDERVALGDSVGRVAGQMWSEVDPDRIVDSWAERVPELTAVVSGAQFAAAREADPYLAEVLSAQGLSSRGIGRVDPRGFSGRSADGRSLLSLLLQPAFSAIARFFDTRDAGQALAAGATSLDAIVRTEVADAGRLADQVSLAAHPSARGYIRQTDSNPCARCLILAGRFYRWSDGFKRHEECNCTHIPVGAGVRPQDPREIYDAMTPAQRMRSGFTIADQEALAEGADIGQVVNARHRPDALYTAGGRRFTREGDTRRGLAGQRLRGTRRLTVDQIFTEATSREHAIDLLHRHGYLLDEPARSRTGAPVRVRQVLTSAQTSAAVSAVFRSEWRRITGRSVEAEFAGSVSTAREHAEGLLRVAERYPATPLRAVRTGQLPFARYAESERGVVTFSEYWSSRRTEYVSALRADARRDWHPYSSPDGVAAHETVHVLNPDAPIERLVGRREIPGYGARSEHEAVAEAVADVLVNGDRAARMSREITAATDAAYRSGRYAGRRPRLARPGPPSRLSPPARSGPPARAAAADLSRLPLTRLRPMVTEHGITVPAGIRKPALVRLVDDLDSGVSPATARQRAVQSIVDERRGVADALTRAIEVQDLSPRAMRSVAAALRRELDADQLKALRPVLEALDAGDSTRLRAAIPVSARSAKLKQIGEPGSVARLPRDRVEWIGDGRSDVMSVIRPGWETTVERKVHVLERAAVQAATPEQVARLAPAKAAKKAAKAAPAKKATKATAQPDLTGSGGLSTDPAVRAVQVENRIRQAYDRAPKLPGGGVRLDDLRNELGEATSRREIDEALRRMGRESGVSLLPNENIKEINRDLAWREAAVRIGPVDYHYLDIQDPSGTLRQLPATPAKAAKKATPRKAPAPPAPARMSAPALRKELTDAGVTLDTSKVPKPVLAEHVTRLRSGSPVATENARLRQAVIDRQRAAAETIAEALEHADTGAEALTVRARARLRRIESLITGWPEEAQIRSLLTAMQTGNPATIRRAAATAERRLGLKRVDVSTMDRSLMQPVGGTIRDGAKVVVVRPGYTVEIGGERVVLAKAVVRPDRSRR